MRWVPQHGKSVPQKNDHYTINNHMAMAADKVRVSAYAAAIRNIVGGRRVLDVGSGPFLLLSRLCLHAGATSVVSVEGSHSSVVLAGELLKHEATCTDPARLREDGEQGRATSRHRDRDRDRDRDIDSCVRLLTNLGLRLHVNDVRVRKQQSPGLATVEAGVSVGSETTKIRPGSHTPSPDLVIDPLTIDACSETAPLLLSRPSDSARLELFEGLSSDIKLPGGIEVVVHEILGHVASAEGVVGAIRELRARPSLTTPSCIFLPRAAGTFIAPTWAFSPTLLERLVHFSDTRGQQRPAGMYHTVGFPISKLIAPAQPMEWWEFNEPLASSQRRVCTFYPSDSGYFEGLHLHLRTQLDDSSSINTCTQATTWSCTWIRLFESGQAMWIDRGSRIDCICDVDVASLRPHYSIDVCVTAKGTDAPRQVASYSWSGDG